jgi:MFS transporter, DHA2 family, multidrug resistance protein
VLVSHLTAGNETCRRFLEQATHLLIGKGANAADAAHQAQGMLYGIVQRQASMQAFIDGFWVLGVIFLAIIPVMMILRPANLKRHSD